MGPELMAVAALASAGISAVGMVMQSSQQAQAHQGNAEIMYENATTATDAAESDAGDIRKRGARQQAMLRAKVGALGLLPDEGSNYELLLDNAAEIELDAQRRIYRGQVEARGYRQQARIDQQQTDQTGAYLSAGGSLLAGGAKAYQYLKSPAGGGLGEG